MAPISTTGQSSLQRLLATHASAGAVRWLSVRPARGALEIPGEVEAVVGKGLVGDHYRGRSGSREVTLVQFEHMEVVAALLRRDSLDPAILRRNIALAGISVAGLERARFRIGAAVLEGTGPCHPCSKLDEDLGPGGYVAMLGHGGITARVIEPGRIALGDTVEFLALRPLSRGAANKGAE